MAALLPTVKGAIAELYNSNGNEWNGQSYVTVNMCIFSNRNITVYV